MRSAMPPIPGQLSFATAAVGEIRAVLEAPGFVPSSIGRPDYVRICRRFPDLCLAWVKSLKEKTFAVACVSTWVDDLLHACWSVIRDCEPASGKARTLWSVMKLLPRPPGRSPCRQPWEVTTIGCSDILRYLYGHFAVKADYKAEDLERLLIGAAPPSGVCWSSNPKPRPQSMAPGFTVKFSRHIHVRIERYWIRSGFAGDNPAPHPRSWKLEGTFSSGIQVIDERKDTGDLLDGDIHRFESPYTDPDDYSEVQGRAGVSEFTFSMPGRNGFGSRQLHIREFGIDGYITGPRYIVDPESLGLRQEARERHTEVHLADKEPVDGLAETGNPALAAAAELGPNREEQDDSCEAVDS
jgi:hypothetical protein